MKKLISWILALSLVLCAAVLPAAAEEEGTTTDAVTSASVSRNGKDGRKNMPGGQPQNGQQPGGRTRDRRNQQQQPGQMPQAPAGVPGTAAQPAVPDGMTEETVTPPATTEADPAAENADSASTPAAGKTKDNRNNARTGKKGKTAITAAGMQITLDLLLEKGVISQEVYNAIMNFIREYTAETAPAVPAAPAETEGAST